MKKRILSLFLILALLLALVPTALAEPADGGEPQSVSAQTRSASEDRDTTPLTLDVSATAVIETAGDYAYFSFTPTESKYYNFYSSGSNDTYGYLYDAEWNMLSSNDDGGEGNNFLITAQLQAGTTYYFGARYYSSSATGEFSVLLTTAPTEGTCGDNVTWTISDDGVLSISGTGMMAD